MKDIFGFAEHQNKATYGLRYNFVLTKNKENSVLNKENTVNNCNFEINSIHWYVPHYTPSLEQQKILMHQIAKMMATELH